MKYSISEGLSYDDVLLVPQYSNIESRSKVDLSVTMGSFKFKHPIIPANMKTVTGPAMANEIIASGGLAILHRFLPIEEQLQITKDINAPDNFAISIGVKQEDRDNLFKFAKLNLKIVCIDIAHGDSKQCIDTILWIKQKFPQMFVIAGNVATGKGAERLWLAGADAVKMGVGPGSLCSTRIETGNGVPQLTAIMDGAFVKSQLMSEKSPRIKRPIYLIADGGIKNAGDIVKALCFADMVMVGNIFAGCKESPGKSLSIDGKSFKEYVGSSTHKTNHIEGVVAIVPVKGPYTEILTKLLEGLSSGCSYQGVNNLYALQDNPELVKITSAGLRESHPHDVKVI